MQFRIFSNYFYRQTIIFTGKSRFFRHHAQSANIIPKYNSTIPNEIRVATFYFFSQNVKRKLRTLNVLSRENFLSFLLPKSPGEIYYTTLQRNVRVM